MQDPELFVVRVWRHRGFRASARAADETEPHWFASASELAFFLGLPPEAPQRAASGCATTDPGENDESQPGRQR